MAGDPSGEGKLLEEFLQPGLVLADVRIDLAVRPFQVDVAHQRRAAVAGAGDVDHVEVMLLDDPVQVDVDEVLARRRPPVPQQPRLDVLELQRLAQQGVVVEIDLADRQVIGGAPVGVHLAELFRRERDCWLVRSFRGRLRGCGSGRGACVLGSSPSVDLLHFGVDRVGGAVVRCCEIASTIGTHAAGGRAMSSAAAGDHQTLRRWG